ncbi:ATP-binding cassette domain-containing protein [Microbacterium radiodurans]|uniref:ATP-binding cassette domain-containing protein n=1 Tax=Microbacterium radiodurans TaxID=661398 RepID=A0A5J5ITZ9_9MICO|nr:ATP-binding cassette domain-containing protein [Microbacterium radiodurans]KAA9086817.1 ATP-binding cassette domain-containing protein [Microbacterium radiodurans]
MPTPDHPVALTGVDVTYPGGAAALRAVDLTVDPGEIFGVIGESGAGKSTLLSLITGEIAPTDGGVRVLGEDPATLSAARLRALRRRIGVVFQGVHLLSGRTVRQNVALPLAIAGQRRDRGERARHGERVDEMLRFVGLDERAEAYPAQLSGGQRQRVGIARALVGRPELLLCDEPTSSLDAGTTVSVLDLLREARERFGTTIVVVTHDLAVVRQICDRVALFDAGALRDILEVAPGSAPVEESYLDRARRELGA